MKLGKKAVTGLSFAIGACVFVSTAFADVVLGTGYNQLKDAVKHTAAQMEEGLDNYTVEWLMELKLDGQTMFQTSTVEKFDTQKPAAEDFTVTKEFSGETSTSYFYSDPKLRVWKGGEDDKYDVTEYPDGAGGEPYTFTSPFHEERAEDVEKIVDALVGNLKEYVQVEETAEGGRVYSGSLSQVQVPALVNAVSSFYMKQIFNDHRRMEEYSGLPEIESDIFVQKVAGTAAQDEVGLLKSLTGDITLSGKDSSGVPHEITLSLVFKLSDIGKTKVVKPDLTDANVEVKTSGGFSSKYVGTYKNNIVIEKEGQFVKIGERTLEITGVEDGKVSGRFYETVEPEFAAEYPSPYNFTFEFAPNSTDHMTNFFTTNFFTYKNAAGEEETGQIQPGGGYGKVYIDLNLEILDSHSIRSHMHQYFDGEMIRVFEE